MFNPRLQPFPRIPGQTKAILRRDSAVMETCSGSGTVSSLWGLAVHPKDLLFLVFRVLPKLLPSLLKRFQKDEYDHAPRIELEIVAASLPELPQDVLMVIFAHLDIFDFIRAGSVCSSWHAAYTELRNTGMYKQSQTPCLFYTSKSAGENVGCLYSLVEQREYKLTFPEPPIHSRFLIGSSNGWLITADERSELHLVNPITCEQIALPSVITIEQVKPIFDDSGTIHKYELSYYPGKDVYDEHEREVHALSDLREYCYYKAFVFPDPSTGSYIVVLIHNPYCQLSFARPGHYKWTWLPPNAGYRDCVYTDGLLYALTSLGEIDEFDLAGPTVTRKVILNKVKSIYESVYLIPAPWGDLLQVWRIVDTPNHVLVDDDGSRIVNVEQEDEDGDALECDSTMPLPYVTRKITVYKVDMTAKVLVKIKSLPHHMLFLGHNQSLCLGAAEHPQLKANHAYFTDDQEELVMVTQDHTRDIGVINLENHERKEILPQLWSNWPCPTWIVLNLSMMNLAFSI